MLYTKPNVACWKNNKTKHRTQIQINIFLTYMLIIKFYCLIRITKNNARMIKFNNYYNANAISIIIIEKLNRNNMLKF